MVTFLKSNLNYKRFRCCGYCCDISIRTHISIALPSACFASHRLLTTTLALCVETVTIQLFSFQKLPEPTPTAQTITAEIMSSNPSRPVPSTPAAPPTATNQDSTPAGASASSTTSEISPFTTSAFFYPCACLFSKLNVSLQQLFSQLAPVHRYLFSQSQNCPALSGVPFK